ncbi:MAG TPA: 1-acyl-sn-glycerol-3-phosphate acyltransferase, partial [Polyangiaceae bacterium]|nr:1-acyl-sn-glycerol-3-phosphate acyltransferase [Polyangiaceae bacterium]
MSKRQDALPPTYEPNPLLRFAFDRLFSNIALEPGWLEAHQRIASEARVVHILQSLNFVEFLALDHITKRHSLPRIRFVTDLGLWVLNPMGKGWLNAVWPKRRRDASVELEQALLHGGSAAFFLKRRANVVELATSGARWLSTELKEGDRLVRALLRLQRESDRPIVIIPELFFWTRQPERDALRARDLLLGPPESPTASWAIAHLVGLPGAVRLCHADPLNLSDFLAANAGLTEEALVRRLIYALMRRFGRERRTVIGPAVKSPERVRAEIVRSPRMRELIEDLSGGDASQARALQKRSLEMLTQLQATPDHHTMVTLGKIVKVLFDRMYDGIEYNPTDMVKLRAASRDGTIVFLPSHKSHVDYLVMSYQLNALDMPVPMIAAGDNLDFFPMGPLFRRSGAFFIRRSFKGDRLYAAIVDSYVRRLLRDGFPFELYLEGGRSRTGKLLPPKLGLLSMIVDAALAESARQVFFVPVSIGYERIIETDSYHRELTGGEKSKEDAVGLLRSGTALNHRYGRINLQFGEHVTLDQIRTQLEIPADEPLKPAKRRALVSRLANRVMDEINRVTAVTPGALTALALLSHPHRGLAHEDVIDRARKLLTLLERSGARMTSATATPSGNLRPEAIREALQLFSDAELIEIHHTLAESDAAASRRQKGKRLAMAGAFYTVPDGKRLALDTSKNIIIHFFVERAILATVLLTSPTQGLDSSDIWRRFCEIAELLQFEFRIPPDTQLRSAFDASISEFIELSILERTGPQASQFAPSNQSNEARQWLLMLSFIIVNYLEGYRIAARTLSVAIDTTLSEREYVKRALVIGQRMYFAGEITRRESTS